MKIDQQKQSLEKWMRLGQHESQFLHWTTVLYEKGFFVCLFFITLFHFWLAFHLPPSQDELYYWSWAQSLQLSYFDHPPMVAYFIALSTSLFGDNIFALRLPAILIGLSIMLMLGSIVKRYQVLLLVLFTPIFFLFAVIMTPDVPFLLFWLCYAIWMIKVNQVFRHWDDDPVARVYHKMPVTVGNWILGGGLLGLGLLSKYTMALAIPCFFLLLLLNHRFKAWSVGFLIHILVAFLVTLPVLIYNIQTDFAPLGFQWSHSTSSVPFSFKNTLEFLGSQALLISALPILMLPWILIKGSRLRIAPSLQVCFYLFLIPFLFFLIKSTHSRLEGNWALACFLTFWPLAQTLLDRNSFKLVGNILLLISFVPAILCSILITIHSISPLNLVPIDKDRLHLLHSKYRLSETIANDVEFLAKNEVVYSPTYQWTSYLRFHKVPSEQIFPSGRRSHFTVKPVVTCDHDSALVLVHKGYAEGSLNCFPNSEVLREYPLSVRGKTLTKYQLVRYTK